MRRGLLRTSVAFRRYWLGQLVSLFGDQVSRIGIPLIAVTTLHASAIQIGLLNSAGSISLLAFGLITGAWVDRVQRRRLLTGCDLARAGVIAVIPCAAAVGVLNIPLLIATIFVLGSLSVVFGTAAVAFLPGLVPDDLIEANARLMQSNAVAQVAGPGIGGVVVGLVTAPFAVAVDAISFLASAACLSIVDVNEPRVAHPEHQPVWRAIGQGLAFVYRNSLLRPSAGCAGTYNLFNAAIVALQVLFLSRTLGLRPAELGLVLGAIGPGALLGATTAVYIGRRLGMGRTMIGGLILAGAANCVFASANGSILVLMTAMFANGLGQPLYNINQASLRQAVVPRHLQGRVTATLYVLAGGTAPVGAVAAGAGASLFGVRAILVVAAFGTMLSALWLLLSPVRRLRSLPRVVCE